MSATADWDIELTVTNSIITSHIWRKNKKNKYFLQFFSKKKVQCWLKIVTQKCCYFVMILEILKCKKHVSVLIIQIFVEIVFVVSVFVTLESSHSLYKRDQSLSVINVNKWTQKKQEFILKLIFFIMKVQIDHFISEIIVIMIKHFSF